MRCSAKRRFEVLRLIGTSRALRNRKYSAEPWAKSPGTIGRRSVQKRSAGAHKTVRARDGVVGPSLGHRAPGSRFKNEEKSQTATLEAGYEALLPDVVLLLERPRQKLPRPEPSIRLDVHGDRDCAECVSRREAGRRAVAAARKVLGHRLR